MPRPTFVIAGGMKCGTTSLHSTLRQHPQIFMSRPKELHFFDHHYRKGMDWYEAFFRPREAHLAWGESTPVYMYLDKSRRRIATDLPDSKVVIVLRDPVSRAHSHYWMYREKDLEPADTFDEGLRLEPERLRKGNTMQQLRYSYVDRGHYIDQIEAFEELVGRDRLHVVLLEDLSRQSSTALSALLAFLGVDPAPAATMSMAHSNYYGHTIKKSEQLVMAGGPSARIVAPADDAWQSGDDETESAAGPRLQKEPMSSEARGWLSDHFRPYNDRLAAWLGRDLSHWT